MTAAMPAIWSVVKVSDSAITPITAAMAGSAL